MTTIDFITELYCRIDDKMQKIPNHSQGSLSPSELVTIGMLFAIKGGGQRAFYRWFQRDYMDLFPDLSERTRLFRRLKTHWEWAQLFLAEPSLLGIIDSYGVELIHPVRKGRNPKGWAGTGISNHRWIVGGKLCLAVNHLGQHSVGHGLQRTLMTPGFIQLLKHLKKKALSSQILDSMPKMAILLI